MVPARARTLCRRIEMWLVSGPLGRPHAGRVRPACVVRRPRSPRGGRGSRGPSMPCVMTYGSPASMSRDEVGDRVVGRRQDVVAGARGRDHDLEIFVAQHRLTELASVVPRDCSRGAFVIIPFGKRTVTPMPSSASSWRSTSPYPVTANFVVMYAPWRGLGASAAIDDVSTMWRGPSAARSRGRNAFDRVGGADHVDREQPLPVVGGDLLERPELHDPDVGADDVAARRTGRRPRRRRRRARPGRPRRPPGPGPRCRRRRGRAATDSAASRLMSSTATPMPSAAKASAIAAPRPEPAPVTTAVPPVESRSSGPEVGGAAVERLRRAHRGRRRARRRPRARRRCPCACSARRRRSACCDGAHAGDEPHHVARAARLLDDARERRGVDAELVGDAARPARPAGCWRRTARCSASFTTSALPSAPIETDRIGVRADRRARALDVVGRAAEHHGERAREHVVGTRR